MKQLFYIIKPFGKYFLVAWIIAIIIFSSLPSIPTLKIHLPKSDIRLDYLIHFCEYGFLTFLAFLTFSGEDLYIPLNKTFIITFSLVLFSSLDEIHQIWIPGRSFNYRDIIGNFLGIIAGVITCVLLFSRISSGTRSQ